MRLEIPRLARTKNLVTGPGTASVVPSALPGTMLPELLAGGVLPLPATSWKDQTPFVNPMMSQARSSARHSRQLGSQPETRDKSRYTSHTGIWLQSYVCLYGM